MNEIISIKPARTNKFCFSSPSRLSLILVTFGVAVYFSTTNPGLAADRQFLPGHISNIVSGLQTLGNFPGTNRLNLAIGLPLRNEQVLDNLLRQIYDPASPQFHQYLMPEQFTEQFGPTEQDYQAVIDFARANGLTVTATHPNRVILDVAGSVADIERVFHVTLRTYRHPSEARDFYSPDAEPSVDLAVPLLHISGLDNYSLPHPNFKIKPADQTTGATPNAGSGPGNSYIGKDFRAAYVPGVTLNGAGQSVGLLQFDGYYSNDIVAYVSQAGLLPVPPLTNVPIDGGVTTPGGNNVEVCLDIEMVISMAPGVSRIYVYEAPNPSPWVDILSRMANDNLAKQLGCSWGGGPANPSAEVIFKQMAAQGQSFFNASGDSDAFTGAIPFPAESTNITQVGGTTLRTTGPVGSYVSETVWNWGNGVGSCGGISPTYSIPVWQQGINMVTNKGSTTKRNIPDVALTGDNVFVRCNNGGGGIVGGTSCAAPLWAGFTAVMNQQAVTGGRPTVGFVNPAIYAIGKGASYNADFHDITTGDNTKSSSPTKFYATIGYDLCTGWGTPAGQSLINALAGLPMGLVVTPATGFTATGPLDGSFNVNAQNYLLRNLGTGPVDWSVINTSLWLNASPAGGILVSNGDTTTVTISLNSTASGLDAGIYTASLWFTNQTDHVAQSVPFVLRVGQPVLDNGGFETGDFTSWSLLAALTRVDNGSVSGIAPHSGTYAAALGTAGSIGYLSQTLATFTNQAYLLSVWFNSPTNVSQFTGGQITNNTPNEFSISWNGSTLFDQVNIGPIGWTNLQFIVTATGISTVLQFGERVDPWYLGLDDVTVVPIPAPYFSSVVKLSNTNAVAFSWNSMAGYVYQVQYSTNLATTNWTVLSTNTAVGPVLTVTNGYGNDPSRFYRILRLP